MRPLTKQIRRYALEQARQDAGGLAGRLAERFGISRQAANAHLAKLVAEGQLSASGTTRTKRYQLALLAEKEFEFPLPGLREDVVWRQQIAPQVADLAENVRDIWHYGITEMVNNVIDHSESRRLTIRVRRNALDTEMWIMDDGEGIFHRIQRLLGLYDPREAILELAKGKLTTDPANHTGEGIFFTSRMFDQFAIRSRTLYFSHRADQEDWLIEADKDFPGTWVSLTLANDCPRTARGVMDQYAEPDEYAFTKTIVPVALARHEGEKLVSRSQAKRLVTRFERFRTVLLDFRQVEGIGQAFADEIFRVFANAHPEVKLVPVNAVDDVSAMISRALAVKAAQ